MDSEHVKRLRSAGCRVARFNPPTWYTLEEVNYRTHRKILVVDGEVGFTGGAGIADHWLGQRAEQGPLARHAGPDARADRAAARRRRSTRTSARRPARCTPGARRPAPRRPDDDGASRSCVRSSPTGGSNDLKRLYLLAIASARRSLDITTPYFVTDESTCGRWRTPCAAASGSGSSSKATSPTRCRSSTRRATSTSACSQLGIEIYEYQPTMMHAKALVVDGVWSMFGSANFDNRSLELNDELNVAVSEPRPRRRASSKTSPTTSVAPAASRSWRKRAMLAKAREWFWSAFAKCSDAGNHLRDAHRLLSFRRRGPDRRRLAPERHRRWGRGGPARTEVERPAVPAVPHPARRRGRRCAGDRQRSTASRAG